MSAVHVTDMLPLMSVVMGVVAESVQLAPDVGAAKVTVAPLSGVPFEVTFATRGEPKAVPPSVLWGEPLAAVIAMVGGGGTIAVFVKAKVAGVVAPVAVAVTEYAPAVELAVKICEVAMPLELVVSVSVTAGVAVANRPLAPVAGAVKVTETPLATGVPLEVTVAANGFANAVLTVALCPAPPVAVMAMVGAAVFVKAKLAGVVAPDAKAVTL